MRASVPANVVDNTFENYPEGFYIGAIATGELRDVNKDGSWLSLKLALEDITPKNGGPTPPRTKFQNDITIATDGVNVLDLDNFSDPDLPFAIRKAAGLLAGLAEALGVATRENGTVSADLRAVATALIDGQFKGERVGFEVKHYRPKNQPDAKVRDQFNRFGPAA